MTRLAQLMFSALAGATLLIAQQAPPAAPDADSSAPAAFAKPAYQPPTHAEKFHAYLGHTFGVGSFAEAAARAGIEQGLDRPSEWQLGAAGYAERFGSAMGLHIARGTATYAAGELFREDLRYVHCAPDCSAASIFKAAFQNTFTAAKGSDGHREFSIARLIGPVSGSLIAASWRPGGLGRRETIGGIGLTYGLTFLRNLTRETLRH